MVGDLKGGGYADAFVGMQYGSEGKGAICARLAKNYDAAVRTGAPNAGHTVYHDGKAYKMRSIPCAWVNPKMQLFIGAGGLINLDVLAGEGKTLGSDVLRRLKIDRNAGIVTHEDIKEEEAALMFQKNGSTCEGVGTAQARKVKRRGFTTAADVLELRPYITDVAGELLDMINDGLAVQLEGTQGFGLSLNHGPYPYVTSRDILSASLLSDAGLPPSINRYTFGVMRTYPIRVAGNSGPMGAEELTWDEVSRRCGAPEGAIVERTTVTQRIRRVSEMDWDMLKRSTRMNGINGIFITFIDYLDWSMHEATKWSDITVYAKDFINHVERELGAPVIAIGTGPKPEHMVYTPWAGQILSPKELHQEVAA